MKVAKKAEQRNASSLRSFVRSQTLCAIVALASSNSYGDGTNDPIRQDESKIPFLKAVASDISMDFSETFASKYILSGGFVVGQGPVNQDLLNLNIGKYLTGTFWTDYDSGNGRFDEVDLYATAHSTLFEIKNGFFKGTIGGSFGFENWHYPSHIVSEHDDNLLVPTLSYKGPINVNITLFHLVDNGWRWDENCAVLDLSKQFKIAEFGKGKVSLAPTLRVTYNDNFYETTGFMQVTSGLSLSWSDGVYSVSTFANYQHGIPTSVRNIPNYGISIRVNDLSKALNDVGELLRK
jgi:hypothetical protein